MGLAIHSRRRFEEGHEIVVGVFVVFVGDLWAVGDFFSHRSVKQTLGQLVDILERRAERGERRRRRDAAARV